MTDWLSPAEVEAWIQANSFTTGRIGRVGVELEWLVYGPDPAVRPAVGHVRSVLEKIRLSSGAAVSFEAGGQLELSSAPADRLDDCVRVAGDDAAVIRDRLRRAGLALVGRGLDGHRRPMRVVDSARYRSLAEHYAGIGRGGRIMMCNSASVQVCLDAGDGSAGFGGLERRWWLLNSLGPVLVAIFANSASRRRGWRCTRQVTRWLSDPVRARPMGTLDRPPQSWAAHVLDSTVVGAVPQPGRTLREWLAAREPFSHDDLARHLRTVLPPVRPSGYLEARMIDAQPEPDGWVVPLAVVASLLDDEQASDRAADLLRRLPEPTHAGPWLRAAISGPADPVLGPVARTCLDIALESLDRQGMSGLTSIVDRFAHRYTFRGRCPADDELAPERPVRAVSRR